MMKKIFKQNINKIIIIAVWLLIWQAAASLTGLELILAGPVNVFKALCTKLGEKDFYIAAGGSFVHIFAGFIIAFVTACIIGFLASFCRWLREFLRPAIVIMQSLPIASFIIVLIIWFGSKNVASYISFIVVFPMIYNSVITGVGNVDSKILEMAQVFNVSCWKKIRCIYAVYVLPYIQTSLKSALGMCWKAGVAAEVIGVPSGSIGEKLYNAKIYLNTPDLFAWTIVIIVISFVFEKCFLGIVSRVVYMIEHR